MIAPFYPDVFVMLMVAWATVGPKEVQDAKAAPIYTDR